MQLWLLQGKNHRCSHCLKLHCKQIFTHSLILSFSCCSYPYPVARGASWWLVKVLGCGAELLSIVFGWFVGAHVEYLQNYYLFFFFFRLHSLTSSRICITSSFLTSNSAALSETSQVSLALILIKGDTLSLTSSVSVVLRSVVHCSCSSYQMLKVETTGGLQIRCSLANSTDSAWSISFINGLPCILWSKHIHLHHQLHGGPNK